MYNFAQNITNNTQTTSWQNSSDLVNKNCTNFFTPTPNVSAKATSSEDVRKIVMFMLYPSV